MVFAGSWDRGRKEIEKNAAGVVAKIKDFVI